MQDKRVLAIRDGRHPWEGCCTVVLGMSTGLHKGELFNLRWSDLDFETKHITVRRANGRRFRSVPMNRSVSEIC